MNFVLPLLIFLPLAGSLTLMLWRFQSETAAQKTAVGFSVATLVWSLILCASFDFSSSEMQVVCKLWNRIPLLYVDGLSIFFVLLTTILVPLCLLASWHGIEKNIHRYLALFLLLESLILGSFLVHPPILFYVFFEATLVPMFFLIGVWGGKDRVAAAIKFFLYTMAGSVLMLIGIISLYHASLVAENQMLDVLPFEARLQLVVGIGFLASFAVKVPMWPVHTWLPAAHVQAPTGVSMILAGVLLKMGGYGLVRFMLPYAPMPSYEWRWVMMALSVVAVIYASLVALAQTNMKKLVAYSSIAHMGVVTLGIFSASLVGLTGAVFHMISHGLVSAGLFFVVGLFYQRTRSLEIKDYGGVAKVMPLLAVGFMVLTCASMGVPGTSGFVGELLVIIGAYGLHPLWAAGIAMGLILAAIYSLKLYSGVMFGPVPGAAPRLPKLSFREKMILGPLVGLILLLGLYPTLILKPIEASTQKIHQQWMRAKAVSSDPKRRDA
jgi:NADH-quinone oxidoreductase subunit M